MKNPTADDELAAPTAPAAALPRRNLVGPVRRIAAPILIAYLVVVVGMTFLETWLVYPIPPANAGDWVAADLDHEDVDFTSADGTKLHGWFVPHPAPKCALLYCHGNGEHVAFNADVAAHLRDQLQASVFLFDYRGYGRSAGRPNEAGCIADGLAAQRWLAERMGITPDQVIVMGRSLGTAVAVAVAAEQGAKALVLENAFSRMTDAAAYHYPWLPVRLAMRNRYDSVARIANYRGPLHQSHGTSDGIVPIQLGRQLFDAAPGAEKRFLELPGQGHNDPFPSSYYHDLARFLDATNGDSPLRLTDHIGPP